MTNKDKKIIVLNEVESTNNYAKQLILSNAAEEGTVVMTHFQEKGKGQQGIAGKVSMEKTCWQVIFCFLIF